MISVPFSEDPASLCSLLLFLFAFDVRVSEYVIDIISCVFNVILPVRSECGLAYFGDVILLDLVKRSFNLLPIF